MIGTMNSFFQINKGFPWTFRINIQTSNRQFECYSLTHKLVRVEDALSQGLSFEFDRSVYHRISEAFVFRFRVHNAEMPSLMVCSDPQNAETPYAMSLRYNPTKQFKDRDSQELDAWDSDEETELMADDL